MVDDNWGVDMKGVACYCGRCGSGCVPHRSGGRQALAGCGRPGPVLRLGQGAQVVGPALSQWGHLVLVIVPQDPGTLVF